MQPHLSRSRNTDPEIVRQLRSVLKVSSDSSRARKWPLYHVQRQRHTLSNMPDDRPWLSIPLSDYEGHMSAPEVAQLPVLAELFQYVLERWRPESVAVTGVAGGNGLDAIDRSVTKRVVGVDINQQYLEAVRERYRMLPGLELHRCDLTREYTEVRPVALVHAALLFEHTGLGSTLDHVLSLVAPAGIFSVVLQLPTAEAHRRRSNEVHVFAVSEAAVRARSPSGVSA